MNLESTTLQNNIPQNNEEKKEWRQALESNASLIEEEMSVLSRGTAEIINETDLALKIFESKTKGTPLKIKLGIDPTAPHIHLGFAVVLRKMRKFQDFGHRIQLIIGDFTARVGDPTGRSVTRKVLTVEEIKENAKTYKDQLSIILDPDKTDVHFNSSWLSPLNFADIISLTSKYTVARIMERDDFSNRFREGKPIGMHEILYPLMQGYDSVALKSDVEMGGTDQKFNILVGRELQREYGISPQVVFLMPILEGTDGVLKMSKSYGNYVAITDPPQEMFGKLMSIPDNLIYRYLELCTDVPMDEIEALQREVESGKNPRDAKMRMAMEIISIYHNPQKAKEAKEEFIKIFSRKEMPSNIPVFTVPPDEIDEGKAKIVSLLELTGMADSKREAKRLIQQGAVKINGEKADSFNALIEIKDEPVLQAGSRKFVKLSL